MIVIADVLSTLGMAQKRVVYTLRIYYNKKPTTIKKKIIAKSSLIGIRNHKFLINYNSLCFKLVSTFILLATIPIFCIAYISGTTATTNLNDRAKESLSNTTAQDAIVKHYKMKWLQSPSRSMKTVYLK